MGGAYVCISHKENNDKHKFMLYFNKYMKIQDNILLLSELDELDSLPVKNGTERAVGLGAGS